MIGKVSRFTHLISMLLCVFSIALPLSALDINSAAGRFREGDQYEKLPAATLQKPALNTFFEKYHQFPLLLEFFSYGCHHCAKTEAPLANFLASDTGKKAQFVRIPVVFHNAWDSLARAYHMRPLLLGRLQDADIFSALHDKGQDLYSKKSLGQFFVSYGMQQSDFDEAYDSFWVQASLKQDYAIAQNLQIFSVPAFVIILDKETAYYLDNQKVSSQEQLFAIIRYLLSTAALSE